MERLRKAGASLSAKHAEAVDCWAAAMDHERQGDMTAALASYRRAFRLWPGLDSQMGSHGLPVEAAREAGIEEVPTSAEDAGQIDVSETPRFAADDPAMVDYLHEHGYAVVAGVADEREIKAGLDDLWRFLEVEVDGWKRGEPETWDTEALGRVAMPENGIIQRSGIGHSDLLWRMRRLPGVLKAFEQVWELLPVKEAERNAKDKEGGGALAAAAAAAVAAGAAGAAGAGSGDGDDHNDDKGGGAASCSGAVELITSFDGANVFRPWHLDASWKTRGGWTHIDQGPTRRGLHGVQGLVTLKDATPATGGLVVCPGSHRLHDRVLATHAMGDADFLLVPLQSPALETSTPTEEQEDREGAREMTAGEREEGGSATPRVRLVVAKAGDLLLWDSRCVHANTPALEAPSDATCPPGELLRAVAYVCMTPKRMAPEEVLERRRRAFDRRITTSHWPHVLGEGAVGSEEEQSARGAAAAAAATAEGDVKAGAREDKPDEMRLAAGTTYATAPELVRRLIG